MRLISLYRTPHLRATQLAMRILPAESTGLLLLELLADVHLKYMWTVHCNVQEMFSSHLSTQVLLTWILKLIINDFSPHMSLSSELRSFIKHSYKQKRQSFFLYFWEIGRSSNNGDWWEEPTGSAVQAHAGYGRCTTFGTFGIHCTVHCSALHLVYCTANCMLHYI